MSGQGEDRAYEKTKSKLEKTVARKKDLKNALLLIDSEKLGIHWMFASGTTGPEDNPISADNPYHVASIGKTFTSLIVARLYERSRLHFDDPIAKYLSPDTLRGLFIYRGIDYSKDVLIRQLLNHTSGIADFYEDRPLKGKSIKELIVENPERLWKPEEAIAYARDNLRPVSMPGKGFHYSDTGYNLLGKIIENVTGKTLHENLHAEIFDPLGMVNSYLMFCSEPKMKNPLPMADTFIGKHEVSRYKSISIDWAGGGVVSTTEDLLLFHRALVSNSLIKKETLELWGKDRGKFGFGMDYGYGIVFLNVGKMTLILSKTLNMWGNFGSIGAYMLYNPAYDVHIIGSFNHSHYASRQVPFIIGVIRILSKRYRSAVQR